MPAKNKAKNKNGPQYPKNRPGGNSKRNDLSAIEGAAETNIPAKR